jgi:glucose-6-phosphate 1-dehydrogenase
VASQTLRGQYRKYRDEANVSGDSQTATFGVVTLYIDNWRWQGVPFYLRSGKALSCRTTQIVVKFRQPPHMMFGSSDRHDANQLVIQIQPAEGIQLHFQAKVPDAGMKRRQVDLDFNFRDKFTGDMPDAYQRLLLDAMQGDASLFARSDEVEASWGIIDPIQATWTSTASPHLDIYESGEWGPPGAVDWMRRQGRQWFDSCPVLK